jgi:NADP-dependent 3-hydroxy acid dehydrogenase YdfG
MSIADVSDHAIADLFSLNGRTAVVTGAAQGLGKAIARRLAEAGAAVLIGDLKLEQAQAAAEEFRKRYGRKVIASRLDVTDSASIAAAAELAERELGGIGIWVNNAGLYPNVSLLEMTDEGWDRVMAVNLRGVFASCREAAGRMIGAGRGGVIVNVVSTAGFSGVAPGVSAYVDPSTACAASIGNWRSSWRRMTSACWAWPRPFARLKATWPRSPRCPSGFAARFRRHSPHASAGSAYPTISPGSCCSPRPTWQCS